MTWIAKPERTGHVCPMPSRGGMGRRVGDLWRCDDCGTLWRIGWACSICDHWRRTVPHEGQHIVGEGWRRATLAQRIRYMRRG